MLKALVNPALLLAVMALCAAALLGESSEGPALARPGVWLLALCATGCIVNGALALARGLTHRPALMAAVWCVVYLVLGSCAWVMVGQQNTATSPEIAAKYRLFLRENRPPYTADEEGDSTLSLAVLLGKSHAVQRLLLQHEPTTAERATVLPEAALLAADNGDTATLRVLLEAGVAPGSSVNGMPLICAAVNSGKRPCLELLLAAGADVNAATPEGYTPLMYAVMNNAPALVRLLREHGADGSRRNAEGQQAADYSRSGAIDALLAQP